MRHQFLVLAILLYAATCCRPVSSAPLIVETDPLPPEEQRLEFELPTGFEIQLVASDPDIGQPMNLAFDARGRLWVTHSVEYPYPAQGPGVEDRDARFEGGGEGPPRDRLTILSGIGADGRPRSIAHFANGLNIPIGHLPVAGGAIVYSIPDVSLHRDTDGDGAADSSQRLIGTFGNVDTHGMVNSLTRWFDGWIYACHGFRNTSHVSGSDGESITMNSGNTFRFRGDGSRVEQYSWGQVNPFGLTFDPWGNMYTADCHSMPVTCVLRGAYYSSFGKPHDGLGFGPDMIDHLHGSTGICGAAWYDADHFPPEYRDCIYICNPVNGQVHRDRIEWHGSSPLAVTQPEFITCRDQWFRPVDVQLGPDGALYVADFYNAVIGHYEVPLDEPRRDRTHGRIWRVVYRGEDAAVPPPSLPDIAGLEADELVALLGDANFAIRLLAANHLRDQFGASALGVLRERLNTDSTPNQRAAALWLLFQHQELDDAAIERLSADPAPVVRTHLARCLAEFPDWSPGRRAAAHRLISDEHPIVRRAAADALGRHPHVDQVPLLLDAWDSAAGDDTHLRHVLRIALRDHLAVDGIAEQVLLAGFDAHHRELLELCVLGARNPAACELLIARIGDPAIPPERRNALLQHAARYAAANRIPHVVELAGNVSSGDPQAQMAMLETIALGIEQRNLAPVEFLRDWARGLALQLLDAAPLSALGWTFATDDGTADNPFQPQLRPSADGPPAQVFFSSLPGGEQRTGRLRSEAFTIPPSLSFHIAGHSGFPNEPAHPHNSIQLRNVATDEVLRLALPPRNDTARQIVWDLEEFAGRRGYLQINDGDAGGAYAWLAVGRFSMEELSPREFSPLSAATAIMRRLELREFSPRLERIAADPGNSVSARIEAARGLLALAPDARLFALLPLAGDPTLPDELRHATFEQVVDRDEEAIGRLLTDAMRRAGQDDQRRIAEGLLQAQDGIQSLLSLMESGHASAQLLLDRELRQRIETGGGEGATSRVEALTRDLPAIDDEMLAFMSEVRAGFSAESASLESGHDVFTKHCAVCHQLGGEGKKVGPQLDGIGVRGVDRLVEDIVDPNRNVDAAFRSTVVLTEEGQIISGLVRQEEDGFLVLADNKGEEVRVALADIEERRQTPLSLMPANLQQTLNREQVRDLLAWLLSSVDAPAEDTR